MKRLRNLRNATSEAHAVKSVAHGEQVCNNNARHMYNALSLNSHHCRVHHYIYPHVLSRLWPPPPPSKSPTIATAQELDLLLCKNSIRLQRFHIHAYSYIHTYMDRQSMQGGGAGGTAQELCYVGGGGQPEVVDGAFLMELLEDTPAADQPPEGADDQLSRVIRSLEAEIGGGTAPEPAAVVGDGESTTDGPTSDDGGLEDMLSDFDSSPGPRSAEAPPPLPVPFEYWAEVPPAMEHDMGGWYVDGDGVVGYEFREQCYYTYGEGSAVEQVYSPLWE